MPIVAYEVQVFLGKVGGQFYSSEGLAGSQVQDRVGRIPQEVVIEDKTTVEQMKLIQQLEEDDKQTIFKLIDKMLTYQKFKSFFQKNAS